jgi:hypothetical protein
MSAPRLETALRERLAGLGRSLGDREAPHAAALAAARERAVSLRRAVAAGLDAFHGAAAACAPELRIELSEPHLDDKHVRSVEFELRRGRTRAIVTVKSRGEVTLVGPFHAGKTEGPCKTFPFDAEVEIEKALGDFLESFLEEAATP